MTTAVQGDAAAAVKPLLRGWSHAVAAVVSVAGLIVLIGLSAGDGVKLAALCVYGVSLVLLFGFSAAYHIPNWSPKPRRVLRRIDHANIFLLIAGTYTPVVTVVLGGWWRAGLLIAIWVVSAAGIALATGVIMARRRLLTMTYLLVGWLGVVATPQLVTDTGPAMLLLLAGGALYTLGALAYAAKRPTLAPRIFGYHEVFHLAVIAASVCFYIYILVAVVPRPVR